MSKGYGAQLNAPASVPRFERVGMDQAVDKRLNVALIESFLVAQNGNIIEQEFVNLWDYLHEQSLKQEYLRRTFHMFFKTGDTGTLYCDTANEIWCWISS